MRIPVRALFTPAIRYLNRLSYPYKFGLMGLGAVIAIAFFVISLHVAMRGAINDTRAELTGIKIYPPVARLLLLSQQHLGLASAAGAEAPLKVALQAKTGELDATIKLVDAGLEKDAASLSLNRSWKAFKDEWQQLKGKASSLQAAQALPAYQKLFTLLEGFLGDLGEASNLISDPDRDTSSMADILFRKLPEATLQTGRLQALSIVPLQTRDMAGDWLKVAPQLAKAARARFELGDAFARIGQGQPNLAEASKAAAQSIQEAGSKLDQTIDQEIIKGAFTQTASDFLPQTTAAMDAMYAPVLKTIPTASQGLLQARLQQLETRFWSYSLGASLIVIVLLYFSAGMFITILQSVGELSEGAHQIAEGNLASQVKFSARDELSTVADHFNAMVVSFGAIIREVHRTADGLQTSSASLAESSSTIAESSAEQSDASSGMAAAVEEMTVGVDEISRHAGTAEAVSRQSGDQSAAGCLLVHDAMAEMDQIASAMQDSAQVISSLGKSSAQINNIVASIKEIADQTNMLALNASIEAARAGEDGKGFAVVADQVRSLAERTTQATQEIYAMVSAIQNGTNRAVLAMNDGVTRVQQGVTLTHKAGTAMERIRDESGKVVAAVAEISLALREQAAASSEIARGVENVAQMAEENRLEVSSMSATASKLEALSSQLANEVRRFHV